MKKKQKIVLSFKYAFNGIWQALKSEVNLKIHFLVTPCVIAAGFLLHISSLEWLAVILCIALVITTELINTTIEKLADIIEPNQNKQIGLVKDIAAGAVLFSAIGAAAIGFIVFIPKIMAFL